MIIKAMRVGLCLTGQHPISLVPFVIGYSIAPSLSSLPLGCPPSAQGDQAGRGSFERNGDYILYTTEPRIEKVPDRAARSETGLSETEYRPSVDFSGGACAPEVLPPAPYERLGEVLFDEMERLDPSAQGDNGWEALSDFEREFYRSCVEAILRSYNSPAIT